jgi:phosphoribosylformylglycinamidine synthase
VLVGELGNELGASLYLREVHGLKRGRPPELNLEREKKMHVAVLAAIRAGLVRSAHDLADGGLLIALAECAVAGAKTFGAYVHIPGGDGRLDALLFGESQGRALLTSSPEKLSALLALLESHGVPARRLGAVGGNKLLVETGGGSPARLSWEVAPLHRIWDGALDSYLE